MRTIDRKLTIVFLIVAAWSLGFAATAIANGGDALSALFSIPTGSLAVGAILIFAAFIRADRTHAHSFIVIAKGFTCPDDTIPVDVVDTTRLKPREWVPVRPVHVGA